MKIALNIRPFIACLLFGCLAMPWLTEANDNLHKLSPRMRSIVMTHVDIIDHWVHQPVLLKALNIANAAPLTPERVHTLDDEWISGMTNPFISVLLDNNVSQRLQAFVSHSQLYVEAFLCSQQGIVIGVYPRTTDFLQADEAKFSQSYRQGTLYIGQVVFDESSQSYAVQISVPVIVAEQTVGVLIVGLRHLVVPD